MNIKSTGKSRFKLSFTAVARKYSGWVLRIAPDIGLRGVAAALAFFALYGFNPQALAATDTWVGSAGSTDWNTGADWLATTAPASGDSLVLTNTNASSSTTLTDTLTNSNFLINGIAFNAGAPAYTMTGNGFELGGAITNNSSSTQTFDNAITLSAGEVLNTNASGGNLAFGGGILAGTGGITVSGGGTVTLNTTASTYTGNTAINQGTTLTLNFNNPSVTTSLINSGSELDLATGTLNILGNASMATSQSFNGAYTAGGANSINAAPASGNTIPTVNLGALTPSTIATGATLEFTGPATNSGASTAGGTTGTAEAALTPTSPGAVAATAIITTTTEGEQTTEGTGPVGLLVNNQAYNGSVPAEGIAYATVGLYDWATTDTTAGTAGTSPYTIIGGSRVAGFYTILNGAAEAGQCPNYDVTGNSNFGGITGGNNNNVQAATFRFNVNAAITLGVNTEGTTGNDVNCSGILVTPNVGQNNITFTANATDGLNFLSHNGGVDSLTVFQNNASGELIFSQSTGGATNNLIEGNTYTQSGAGTVSFLGHNSYAGGTYLDGGNLEIAADYSLGTVTSNVTLNGGTLVGNYTGKLDNGTTANPIVLGSAGGGLGATAGTTLTVDGTVSGSSGAGPLVIGIPAYAANSNTSGLLPGTGAGTANSTPVYATGLVALSNASNSYTGGTVIDSGTLQLASPGTLGTGAVTLNGGAFQWGTSTPTDISANGLAVTSLGGTLDSNGNTVTLASPISGPGSLTVVNSTGSGSITSNANNTFSGGLTVNSGDLSLGGANVYTGATAVNSGTLKVSGTLSQTATVSVNNGTLELAANNALNPAAPITLGTGVLQMLASQNEALGTLTLSGGGASTLSLGASGDVIIFADSSALAWNGTLTIPDWTGLSAGGGSDQVFIGTTDDLTQAQLADITFTDGNLNGVPFSTMGAAQLPNGEVVAASAAVPEPGEWAMMLAGMGMLCGWQRRRLRAISFRKQATVAGRPFVS